MEKILPAGFALPLLMGDAVVLLRTIEARLAKMDAIDPNAVADDALAELYEDRDALDRLRTQIRQLFQDAFHAEPDAAAVSYEADLK